MKPLIHRSVLEAVAQATGASPEPEQYALADYILTYLIELPVANASQQVMAQRAIEAACNMPKNWFAIAGSP